MVGWPKGQLIFACALLGFGIAPAQAASDAIKIGLISDFSSVYADLGGKGSLEAAHMAVEDFGGKVLGKPVEIVSADGQNKPDVAAGIARKWFDTDGVDMITDLPTTGMALAVIDLARERHKVVMVTSAGSSDITGKFCSPYTVHWTFDTYSIANSTGLSMHQQGSETWFLVQVDTVFGSSLASDLAAALQRTGGKILGSVKHPTGTSDFSSYLLQAQASKAEVIALANAGGDTANAIKQAAEFGITRDGHHKLAAPAVSLPELHGMGPKVAQGLVVVKSFYWDLDDKTRQWSQRFYARTHAMPTMMQAGTYGAITHYLKAIQKAGSTDADKVMAQMREMPIDDPTTQNAKLRIDGRVVRDMYLFEVKRPEESKGEWDLFKKIATIPGDQAFRPLDAGLCPLVHAVQSTAK